MIPRPDAKDDKEQGGGPALTSDRSRTEVDYSVSRIQNIQACSEARTSSAWMETRCDIQVLHEAQS
jgi:hypothetical protein